jgi:formate hydrogenlyase subunit 3/multisubunit Na+/H+ antiporter MnhD subunit
MSAPIIWIVLPFFVAVILWFFKDRESIVGLGASGFSLLLSLLAAGLSIGSVNQLGPISFEIATTLSFFGRNLVLTSGERSFLIFIYMFGAVWFICSRFLQAHRYFAPLGLGMIAILIAAVAVEPFLYAALMIELAVLISIPLIVPPESKVNQGGMRYLIYLTLGMVFILFAGWASGGVEANPVDQELLIQAVSFLGLGFGFWLALFPFHSWVPMLSEKIRPFLLSFIVNFLSTAVLFLFLKFIDAFTWLRNFEALPEALRLIGAIVMLTTGVWMAVQNDLRRMFGYAIVFQNGLSILSLGLLNEIGLNAFAMLFLPRMLAFLIWAIALESLNLSTDLSFDNARGLLRQYPFAVGTILLVSFSVAGLPLLAFFPIQQVIFENLVVESIPITIVALVGSEGLLIAGFRQFFVLSDFQTQNWRVNENLFNIVMMSFGVFLMIAIGLFPGWLLSGMATLLHAFERLGF